MPSLRKPPAAQAVDVSERGSTLALAAAVRERFGRADILVNNAAIYHSMRMDPQLTVDIDYWRKVFSVNLDGTLLMTQAVAPMMIEAGWGRIVMQSSTAAYLGGGGHYGVSKLALLGLTRGFAWAGPDDLVGTLLFLCSEASAWMTGQTMVVDGGLVVRY